MAPSSIRPWLLFGLAALVAGGLVYALRPTHAAHAERPSITAIAVLPLDNLSADPSQEYFADGMTEALIGNLARIRALRVVSRTSVMRFKGAAPPLTELARTLNVDAVLEGSVQRTGDRVRVSVQLIHAATDAHLWAREYERELTDVLKLQSDVARAVADEVQARLTAEERARLASVGSVHPAAYQEFLLGQHYLWRLTEEDLARAIAPLRGVGACGSQLRRRVCRPFPRVVVAGYLGCDDVQAGRIALPCSRREGAGARPWSPGSARLDRSPQVRTRVGLERRQAGVHTCPRHRSQ